MAEKLTDNQVDDRLRKALDVIGDAQAESVAGNTALEVARRALKTLSLGLLFSSIKRESEP